MKARVCAYAKARICAKTHPARRSPNPNGIPSSSEGLARRRSAYPGTIPERASTLKGLHHRASEQGIAEEEALKKGMEEKSKEFVEKGRSFYAKAYQRIRRFHLPHSVKRSKAGGSGAFRVKNPITEIYHSDIGNCREFRRLLKW